jgi:hypothetical protein
VRVNCPRNESVDTQKAVRRVFKLKSFNLEMEVIPVVSRYSLIALALLALAACTRTPETSANGHDRVIVFKNESCGCCKLWVRHLRDAGFAVEVHDIDNLGPTKQRVGVPVPMGACHTAEIGRYFVEGHVPAEDIKRLLREGPDAKGLTVPGMPVGSPGMEVPSGQSQPYDVYLVSKDGTTSVYAHHGG